MISLLCFLLISRLISRTRCLGNRNTIYERLWRPATCRMLASSSITLTKYTASEIFRIRRNRFCDSTGIISTGQLRSMASAMQ